MEGEPGGNECCDDEKKADISKAAMDVFKVRDLHLTSLLALFIFLGRGGGTGEMHRGIIAYPFDRCAI
jgi:hypothetical protein